MKRYFISFLAICLLLGLGISVQKAFARERVYCVFKWESNPSKNIISSEKAIERNYISQKHLIVRRDVRNREHDRLVRAGVVNVRISGKRGDRCTFNQPENTLIDIKLYKKYFRIDQTKALPECHNVPATVECRSTLPPDMWR